MTALLLLLCRALLQLAPSSFRVRYAPEILGDLAHQAARESPRFMFAALGDLWRTVRRERRLNSAGLWADLSGDVSYAWRGWCRAPRFAVTLVVTLAVGLGLSAAVFSFADGYLFRPLPFPGSDRAYNVRDPNATPAALRASDVEALRQSPVAGYGFVEWSPGDVRGTTRLGTSTVTVSSYQVTPGFRDVMVLPLVLGRDFTLDDHRAGATKTAWLAHRFWRSHFGGDPTVVGRALRIEGFRGSEEVHIVGVLGPEVASFDLNNALPELVVPRQGPTIVGPNRLSFPMVLLPEDVSVEVATERIAAVLNAVAPAADGRPRVVRMRSVRDYQVAGGAPTARVFLTGALLVMALAMLNVIHLLLARGAGRIREVQLRASLGAGRWRIVRTCLVDSLLLAGVGIGIGMVIGRALTSLIASSVPELPVAGRNLALVPMLFDWRVVAFALSLGIVVALVGAVWPMWQALRQAAAPVGDRATRTSHRLSRVILTSQLTVATVIVVGTVFIGLGIFRYLYQPLGIDLRDRFSIFMTGADQRALSGQPAVDAVNAIRQVPGVAAVAFTGGRAVEDPIVVDGQPYSREQLVAGTVPPSYFEARGLTLERGRWFGDAEWSGADVAVVDAGAARLFWSDRDALGNTVQVGSRTVQVIGVTTPVRQSLDRAPIPRVYVPAPEDTGDGRLVAVSPSGTADELSPRIAAAVGAAVPGATAVVRPMTFDTEYARQIGEARFQAPMVVAFGVLATALAGIGIFGLVSYLVERRTREFGIRVAVGASRQHIWRSVQREAVYPALVGLMIGSTAALALESVVESTVFGWQSSGPLAVAVVAIGLLGLAVLAALIPAARAARVDPAITLRAE